MILVLCGGAKELYSMVLGNTGLGLDKCEMDLEGCGIRNRPEELCPELCEETEDRWDRGELWDVPGIGEL